MHRGMGKVSCSRRRSSGGHPYDDRPRLSTTQTSPEKTPPDMSHTTSAPSSYLDTSIPFNLPPRRSMKMLKDGSDFVWPDAAHALFVRGLQAWKFINIGSKRTRAPRGEGKTDFLTRYLQSHGVERTKKQVASHLQVLRTEWRNLDNPVLLSLVDETASHTRSLSEPSLPPPATPSTSSPSATSISVFNPSPEPSEERAVSTPALPSPVPTVSPVTSSSLFHPAHNIYGSRSVAFPVTLQDDPYSNHSASEMASWQAENTVWNTPADRFASHQAESYSRHQPQHYPVAGYDLTASFHDHQRSARPMDSQLHDSPSFGAEFFDVQALSGLRDPSSSVSSLAIDSHSQSSLHIETVHSPTHDLAPQVDIPLSPYDSYNNPSSYPILQQPAPRDSFGNASMSYGIEPYQPQFSTGEQQHLQQSNPSHTLGIVGAASYDVVEPDFLAGVSQVQPQWVRPPATFPRSPDTSERRRSPEL